MEKNFVYLNCWNGIIMPWQSDKSDFVSEENWKEEEHEEIDFQNALEKSNNSDPKYLGKVEFTKREIGD